MALYLSAADDVPRHDDLGDVEDDPGDVAAEEDEHDADDDGGQGDLPLYWLSLAAVGVSAQDYLDMMIKI